MSVLSAHLYSFVLQVLIDRDRGITFETVLSFHSICRLGLHLTELAAAKAYDRVAIKKWGAEEASSKINFPLDQYNIQELDAIEMQDLVAMVRGAPEDLSCRNGRVVKYNVVH